jgi:hypothetical protein
MLALRVLRALQASHPPPLRHFQDQEHSRATSPANRISHSGIWQECLINVLFATNSRNYSHDNPEIELNPPVFLNPARADEFHS